MPITIKTIIFATENIITLTTISKIQIIKNGKNLEMVRQEG